MLKRYKFLPKLFTVCAAALLLSGCAEALSFTAGLGVGFFSGMQYQKSQIKSENSVYMPAQANAAGNADATPYPNVGAGGAGGYPDTGGGSYSYSAPVDSYGAGGYPPPSPVASAPLPPPSAMPAPSGYAPPPQAYGYGQAPQVPQYGGYYYAPPPSQAMPAPVASAPQGQQRATAYGYAPISYAPY